MLCVDKQKDVYHDKMCEIDAWNDGLRSDGSRIQNSIFDFLETINDR